MAGILIPMLPGPNYGTFSHGLENELEADSSTYKKGAVLILSANRVAEAAANPVNIVGVSNVPGKNGTNKLGQYIPAVGHMVFEGQIDDGTLTNTYALNVADLLAQYGITKEVASGFWFVDQSKTGVNSRVVVIGFKSAVGATNARVFFMFRGSQTIYN